MIKTSVAGAPNMVHTKIQQKKKTFCIELHSLNFYQPVPYPTGTAAA